MIALDKIRFLFETVITEDSVGFPIQYENVLDSEALQAARKLKQAWGRLVIRDAKATAVTCGDNVMRRYNGVAMLSLFFAQGTGTADLRDAASFVSNLILQSRNARLYIYTPVFNVVGKTEDWFQGNVTVPFEFDQLTN